MMMNRRKKKVITTNFTTFQTSILIINNIITLIAYLHLTLPLHRYYRYYHNTILWRKIHKKEQKRTIISLFLCKNRKKKNCWMNGAQSKGIEPRSKQVRNLKYTVQWQVNSQHLHGPVILLQIVMVSPGRHGTKS